MVVLVPTIVVHVDVCNQSTHVLLNLLVLGRPRTTQVPEAPSRTPARAPLNSMITPRSTSTAREGGWVFIPYSKADPVLVIYTVMRMTRPNHISMIKAVVAKGPVLACLGSGFKCINGANRLTSAGSANAVRVPFTRHSRRP